MAQPGKRLEFNRSQSSTRGAPASEPSSVARELYLGDATSVVSPIAFATSEAELNDHLIVATTAFARASIECERCALYSAVGKNDEAIAAALAGLADIGAYLGPADPTFYRAIYVAMRRQKSMGTLSIVQVKDLPLMQDPLASLTMKLLSTAIYPSMTSRPNLAVLLLNLQIDLVLQFGQSEYSPAAFLYLALATINAINHLNDQRIHTPTIHKTLDCYLALSKTWPRAPHSLRMRFDYLQFARQWHPEISQDPREAPALVEQFIESGDLVYAASAAMTLLTQSFASGQELSDLITTSEQWSTIANEQNIGNRLDFIGKTRSSLRDFQTKDILEIRFNLRTNAPDMKGAAHFQDVESSSQEVIIQESAYQGLALTLLGEFAAAQQILQQVLHSTMFQKNRGNFKTPIFNIYIAITIANLYPSASGIKRIGMRRLMRLIRRNLVLYGKISPRYSQHKVIFVDALWDIMREKPLTTVCKKLAESTTLAGQLGYISDEACIAEFFGRFLLVKNEPTMAAAPIKSAHDAYERWGLKAKVREMNELYQNISSTEFKG
ncbi:MAG: hypothetical protein NTY08_00770 [Proteobacteria bacterium]|nr:hypothetical protein [Pseudomonadota bacterium]